MRKGFRMLVFTALFSTGTAVTAFAGTWQGDGGQWKYLKDNGAYAVSEWQSDQGKQYYFDAGGVMQTGWLQAGDSWYYLESSGAIRTTNYWSGGRVYHFEASGVCTNPAGDAITSKLEEASYMTRSYTAVSSQEKVAQKTKSYLTNIQYGSYSNMKKAIDSLRDPFQLHLNAGAPASYAAADDWLKNGCEEMMAYLDQCILILDDWKSGALTAEEVHARAAKAYETYERAVGDMNQGYQMLYQ